MLKSAISAVPLGLRQALLVLIFAMAIAVILKEPVLRIKGKKIPLDYGIAPPLAVALLAIFGYINVEVLRDALLGIRGLVPWEVIVIFFAGAYICISIDQTGVLEYASLKIIRLSGGQGLKLYYGLVGLTAFLTVFTSNDIVTLTITPLICYMARHSKINPIPYLMAVFFTSNTWSMIFYIGNPPNIIVAQAFQLGFLPYAKLMALPTLVAGLATMALVHFLFRRDIAQNVELHSHVSPESSLHTWAAFAEVTAFALLFVTLFLSSYLGIQVWEALVLFALIFTALNLLFSFRVSRTAEAAATIPSPSPVGFAVGRRLEFDWKASLAPMARVPWKMLPLIVCFFIIIQLFNVLGLTDLLAEGLSQFRSTFAAALATGAFSALGSNLMINQPTTILFANALQSPSYLVSGTARLASGLALVVGTNLGGNLTLFGALAGLMWRRILAGHGIEMSFARFLGYSIRVIPLIILLTSLVVALQMMFLA